MEDMAEVRSPLAEERKKTRGRTRLQVIAMGQKDRKELEWNEYGQPVGETSKRFSSTLGVLSREGVPININSWNTVDVTTKESLWALLMQKYIVDACHKKFILRIMGKLWQNWKSDLSVQIRKIVSRGSDVSRHIALIKPIEVKPHEWDEFVKIRMSDTWKEKSEKMQQVRAKHTLPHTLSRKGYARLEHEMREIEEYSQISTIENLASIREDALAKVLGPELPGRVRGLGFGVTPSKVDAQIQNNSWKHAFTNEMTELKERQKKLEDIITQIGHKINEDGSSNQVIHPSLNPGQSHQGSTHGTSCRNLDNAKCKLLNWTTTSEVVARAEITSSNPTSMVHHVILGPDCYKVWVKEIIIPGVPLFRGSSEFRILDDALRSTVAWPHKYIKFD